MYGMHISKIPWSRNVRLLALPGGSAMGGGVAHGAHVVIAASVVPASPEIVEAAIFGVRVVPGCEGAFGAAVDDAALAVDRFAGVFTVNGCVCGLCLAADEADAFCRRWVGPKGIAG